MWSKTWKYVVYLRPALRIDCRGDHLWKTVDRSLPRLTGAFFRAWLRLRHGAFWGCAPAPLTKLDLIDWLIETAPSHYLNQYWNMVNGTLRNKLQWNINRNSYIFIQENALENVVCEMASICLGLNVLKNLLALISFIMLITIQSFHIFAHTHTMAVDPLLHYICKIMTRLNYHF